MQVRFTWHASHELSQRSLPRFFVAVKRLLTQRLPPLFRRENLLDDASVSLLDGDLQTALVLLVRAADVSTT